ncbi:MATH and LRR domain-containing protein PFE0570w isoform X1 [Vespa crabro]|uniref:MATH and LRR domain-containing protein PFE0570w isoform X1 n=1 Tax=Vespa crabro TaxID=7445 RepID=UPI001F013FE5|nr:MATH and LRR domain-containing protein PFE0570w isoform X1 [Vespa crabro]XP_046815557.1 MATH and LRR domain-containing protein PFE0570w isoform X1 [Vespa crabro]XP_046815558.1 MATH and LRR domain-containing protein PFE0570w isoform X1 [Vespa crabro]XP_046815559.1 MATH and LRR domain-containing protein PFE0570w isoform X1 [Vespa crabro]XP_046815560.1 MATH and LRR domain-containing protein PFE0570w isoform X1 [Vespa crabro]XP_046815561.1 MATH and LRR domain-containing protein PFE0570w isoform
METLRNDTVHVSTSIASNHAQIDIQNTDELSKQKEEELLYRTGEDGDEEEALSDDSLRLRLSDDEAEVEEVTLTCINPNQSDKETENMDEKNEEECNKKSDNEIDNDKEDNINIENKEIKILKSNYKKTNNIILISKDNDKLISEECNNESVNNSSKTKNKNEKTTKTKNCNLIKKNCDDSKLADDLNNSKNLNNSICKENDKSSLKEKNEDKECSQLKLEDQNEEVDIKQNDQCYDGKQNLRLIKNDKELNSNYNMTVSNSKNDNSTIDEHSEDKQKINTSTTILNQCQENSQHAISNLNNDNSKTVQNCLIIDQKVNNSKCGKKVLDDEINSCQSPNLSDNHSLKKQTGKLNSSKIISDNNNTRNINQSTSEAINVDSDINELLISNDESSSIVSRATSLESTGDTKNVNDESEKRNLEIPKPRRRRRSKKLAALLARDNVQENRQGIEGRQKRRTAKNAEEIIRKKFLVQDSDVESSDNSDKFVTVNHKANQHMESLSPSLKRNCSDMDVTINGNNKRLRSSELEDVTIKDDHRDDIKSLNYIHKFFRRDLKEKLPKLKQEELEELLIQKIVETITMRGEIGRLREQARISEKNQEATRTRCQLLAKQIKDFEMVLSRNAADRRANNDKPTAPIKINRSVGLQVNFITEHGIQSLRQLHQSPTLKSVNISTTINSVVNETNNNALNQRKGIKVRSPRKLETPIVAQPVTISHNVVQPPPLISTVTPTALVVSKNVEPQHSVNLQNQPNNIQQLLPNQQQTVVLNGKVPLQTNRQSTTINVSKTKTNDLIDLTDEEEKNKSTVSITSVSTSTDPGVNVKQKTPQPCFPRVIQTIPANVAITTQPANIRVVHTASHPTPTALVNNMNAPRLAYVMQSGVGAGRQLLITSNSNQIRPVNSGNRPPFTTLAYKNGISTNANGTVRVITTSAGPNVQLKKHPAPLPDSPHYAINPVSKLPPPAPSLKISKVANGIVLSWNMTLSEKYADIVSYQLYAYQEVAGVPPSTGLWKKVGDVRALPLPMACTLTQFSEGNNYYFAVRAVDTHSRKGQYSAPGNISL